LFYSVSAFNSFAQTNQQGKRDTWYENFSVHGYYQMQFAATDKDDSVSLHSESAGTFDRFVGNKFMLRRARTNLRYNDSIFEANVSFDVTERGFQMKDSWFSFKDPWIHGFKLNSGIFIRPFGEELELSSQDREMAERTRVIQTLFPGVRDLGVNVQFQLPKENKWHFLKLDVGIYHGTGGNLESDKFKDFNGRIVLENPFKLKKIDYHFGYSAYLGKLNHLYDIEGSASNYRFVWQTVDTNITINGVTQSFTIMRQDVVFSDLQNILNDPNNPITIGTYRKSLNRIYQSFHGQIKWESPFGKLTIRAEYILGQQVSWEGTLGNPYVFTSNSPTGPFTGVTWPKFDSPQPYNAAVVGPQLKPTHSFVRQFQGGYIYFHQEIGKSKHSFTYRFDYYDPNREVKGTNVTVSIKDNNGNDLGPSGLSVADVMMMHHGFAYQYAVTEKLLVSLFVDIPVNEITSIEPLGSNQIGLGKYPHPGFLSNTKDNVAIVRVQFKF
jgi:hypothetical protein